MDIIGAFTVQIHCTNVCVYLCMWAFRIGVCTRVCVGVFDWLAESLYRYSDVAICFTVFRDRYSHKVWLPQLLQSSLESQAHQEQQEIRLQIFCASGRQMPQQIPVHTYQRTGSITSTTGIFHLVTLSLQTRLWRMKMFQVTKRTEHH